MTDTDQGQLDDNEPGAPEDPEECPACSGEDAVLLGALGNKRWFRCRDCGVTFEETLVVIPASARSQEEGEE